MSDTEEFVYKILSDDDENHDLSFDELLERLKSVFAVYAQKHKLKNSKFNTCIEHINNFIKSNKDAIVSSRELAWFRLLQDEISLDNIEITRKDMKRKSYLIIELAQSLIDDFINNQYQYHMVTYDAEKLKRIEKFENKYHKRIDQRILDDYYKSLDPVTQAELEYQYELINGQFDD